MEETTNNQSSEFLFSQRLGQTPLLKKMQLNGIDDELKNTLWNIYSILLLDKVYKVYNKEFSFILWHNFFKKDADTIPYEIELVKASIKGYFFDSRTEWYRIYDLIEFSTKEVYLKNQNPYTITSYKTFISAINNVFERENAAYRFVNGVIAPITNSFELNELSETLERTLPFSSLKGVNIHLTSALRFLSDKQSPDYRNSIKESISAVESIAKLISNKEKDSLGASLNRIKRRINLHASLEKGFSQIYGYTSDEKGIRHALMDSDSCDFDDAKYMLISCSTFVNYLISKSIKAGIEFT